MEEIRKLLEPHYGHLNFLVKIKGVGVSIDDISNLIELLNDKQLVSNLPKNLHDYNSYYALMKDLFFVKKHIVLISNIKKNLSSESKKVILSILDDDMIVDKLNKIFLDDNLKSNFLRWSGRVKDSKFAKFYINSIFEDSKIFDIVDGEKSNLIELTNFNKHSKYIPSSWCIRKESTFYEYMRKQRIFILKYNGGIFGINIYKDNIRPIFDYNHESNNYKSGLICDNYITIMNQKNISVSIYDNKELYDVAKSELLKLDLFGVNKQESIYISNQRNPIRRFGGIFRRLVNIFRN